MHNQHPQKTGFSRAALLLVGPRLLNFAALRGAAQRDVTTGDQHPMRLTSIKIDTSMFKK